MPNTGEREFLEAILGSLGSLDNLGSNRKGSNARKLPRDEEVKKLKELQASYAERTVFKPGDLVEYKPGLSNTRLPREGQVCIVMDVQEGKRNETAENGSQYKDTPEEVLVGIIDSSDNMFMTYWLDMNRLQRYVATNDSEQESTEETV